MDYTYSFIWENDNRILDYEGRLSFKFPMNRVIIAASINLVPLRFDYQFKTDNENVICLGFYATMDYNYELYPELPSG